MKVFNFLYNLIGLFLAVIAVFCFFLYVIAQQKYERLNIKKGVYDLTNKWKGINPLRQRL